jgi:hypothetical protein
VGADTSKAAGASLVSQVPYTKYFKLYTCRRSVAVVVGYYSQRTRSEPRSAPLGTTLAVLLLITPDCALLVVEHVAVAFYLAISQRPLAVPDTSGKRKRRLVLHETRDRCREPDAARTGDDAEHLLHRSLDACFFKLPDF